MASTNSVHPALYYLATTVSRHLRQAADHAEAGRYPQAWADLRLARPLLDAVSGAVPALQAPAQAIRALYSVEVPIPDQRLYIHVQGAWLLWGDGLEAPNEAHQAPF